MLGRGLLLFMGSFCYQKSFPKPFRDRRKGVFAFYRLLIRLRPLCRIVFEDK